MMMKAFSTDQNKYELVKVKNNDDDYDDDVFNQARKNQHDEGGIEKNEMMMMLLMCSTNHDKFHQVEVSHSQNEIISFAIQDFLELGISEFSLKQ